MENRIYIYTIMKSLIEYLHKAEIELSNWSGGYSGEHFSAQEFHKDLKDRIAKLEKGDKSVIDDLWIWFAPTCQWDDFVGDVKLGDAIFTELNKIKRNGI